MPDNDKNVNMNNEAKADDFDKEKEAANNKAESDKSTNDKKIQADNEVLRQQKETD